jgi:hypothetical protein
MKSLVSVKKLLPLLICGAKMALSLGLIALAIFGAFFVLPARQNYHIRESFVFSDSLETSDVFLGVLVPKSGPYQSVSPITIQWPGDYQIENHEFVDAIRFSGTITPGESKSVIIEYDVKLRQSKISWEASIEPYQTQPQTGIESDHPLIQDRASQIGDHLFQDKAYQIYSFTSEYLTYVEVLEDCVSSSALKSYEIGSCVCAGYARLMVALLRASDIPSEMVLGFTYPDPIVKREKFNNSEHPGNPHAWVEFNSFGKWTMADPTMGTGLSKRLFFHRSDGRHIRYGELEQLSHINQNQRNWALNKAQNTLGDFECFRYKATASSEHISLAPITSVKKVWDGRWANTLLAWAISTFMLCKFRSKILS